MSLAPTQVAPAAATAEQGWRRWATPRVALLAIAASYSLVVLTQLRWFDFLVYDEVVYATQFARGAEPLYMTAPRAWGMPLLLAPVDTFTSSIPVLRAYLGVLAGVGLYLAFHPWLRVSARWVAPIAAGLFATLWTSRAVRRDGPPQPLAGLRPRGRHRLGAGGRSTVTAVGA